VTNPRCHGNEIWDTIGYNSSSSHIALKGLAFDLLSYVAMHRAAYGRLMRSHI